MITRSLVPFAAFSSPVNVPPSQSGHLSSLGGGARALFPNSGWYSNLPCYLLINSIAILFFVRVPFNSLFSKTFGRSSSL